MVRILYFRQRILSPAVIGGLAAKSPSGAAPPKTIRKEVSSGLTESPCARDCHRMICSDLDFEPDLHDLCGGHAEISRGRLALRCIAAKSRSRQTAIPGTLPLATTITRRNNR